jgi:hypothetical protein
VVESKFDRNLLDTDVDVSAGDELDAVEDMMGLHPGKLRVGERQNDGRPRIKNERWEDGLRLKFRTTDGKHEMVRFLSMADMNEMLLGTRTPLQSITKDHAESFGRALMARTTPIVVSMFDANVDLDKVHGTQGSPDGTLDGTEAPISFLPRERP